MEGTRTIATATALLAGLVGCSGIEARSDYDPAADFAAFRTFTVTEGPGERPASLPGYSDLAAARIRDEIARQLESKGLVAVDEDSPADLLVRFTVTGKPRTEVQGTDPGWGWDTWYGRGDVWTIHYVEGTLVIDMLDRARDRVVWHGWARTPIFESSDGERKAQEVIDAILSRFPPAPRR